MNELMVSMGDMNCINAYTHNDLDGAVSLLALMWALPGSCITYQAINNMEMDKLKNGVQSVNNPSKTFILDLALREEFLPETDLDHVTFIDHHETSLNFIPRFKKAKIIHKEITSNALLMAQIFKGDKFPIRTDAQKTLIALADDYDCYRLNIPESYDLNLLFWSEYKNNFSKFIKDYYDGFKPFTNAQKKHIAFLKQSAREDASKLPVYEGYVNFGSKKKKVIAAMGEKFTSGLLDVIAQTYKPDILFFINSKSEKICIRQHTFEDPIDVGNFAEKICEGGGHRHAGGGKITPLFMEVTKNLSPLNSKL